MQIGEGPDNLSSEVEAKSWGLDLLDILTLIKIKEGIGRPKDQKVALELKAILAAQSIPTK
jgi:hypothetical protein